MYLLILFFIGKESLMSQIRSRYCRPPRIDILPNDILLEIFYTASRYVPTNFSRKKPSAIVVSLVCTRWRQLALRYPLSWTNIYIPMYPDNYVILFFKRSKSAAIDVTVDTTQRRAVSFSRYLHTPKTSKENIGRLRSLSIQASKWNDVRRFFESSKNDVAPILQRLEVTMKTGIIGMDQPIFKDAPSLCFVKSNCMPFDCLPSFANITHFDIVYYDYSDLFDYYDDHPTRIQHLEDFYRSCPNLTSLVLRNLRSDSIGCYAHNRYLPVDAPKLQSLAIDFGYASYSDISSSGCTCLKTALNTPNLKYLEVSSLPSSSFNLLEHMSRITKSCIDSSSLTVRLNCAQLSGCLHFLKGLPQSTNLELSNVSTEEIPQVLSMSNFSKIALDLKWTLFLDLGNILPQDVDVSSPVVLYVPLSSFCNPHLLKAASTRENVSITTSPFREEIIQVSRADFFTADEWETYPWDLCDCDAGYESPCESQSGSY
ncbi:hypothetical protein BDQ17DRAFT_676451 [Cyathus striatus]|nr:hypothetical protein BDQ17DRAFT_676451 [Cyathus striatus]